MLPSVLGINILFSLLCGTWVAGDSNLLFLPRGDVEDYT